jgi:hypothetical protein
VNRIGSSWRSQEMQTSLVPKKKQPISSPKSLYNKHGEA